MSRNKIRSTVCIVFIVLNVFAAFFIFGTPENDTDHIQAGTVVLNRTAHHDVVRLTSDAVAVRGDEEIVYEAGTELEVVEYNEDGSLLVFDMDHIDFETDGSMNLTVLDPEYEDVTEEVRLRYEELVEKIEKEEAEERAKERRWFLFNSLKKNALGDRALLGFIAAFVVAFCDIFLYVSCKKKGKFGTFIVLNLLMPPLMFVLWMLLPQKPICR